MVRSRTVQLSVARGLLRRVRRTFAAIVVALCAVGAYPLAFEMAGQGVHWDWVSFQGLTAGHPVGIEKNATLVEEKFLGEHPDQWGGAYVDRDVFVVLTVSRTVEVATRLLRSAGVTGSLDVRRVSRSMANLQELTAEVDPALSNVLSVGPLYSRNVVVVRMQWPNPSTLSALRAVASDGSIVAQFDPSPHARLNMRSPRPRP